MFQKFTIVKEEGLTEERLGQILLTFQTTDLPQIKQLQDYYNGKQKILFKEPVDAGRPDNRIVTNYCRVITENYQGYLLGKPITFTSPDADITELQEIFDYNDMHTTTSNWLRSTLIAGRGFLINYIDEDGAQRMQVLDPATCIPVYDNTIGGELLYVIRFWEDTSKGDLATDISYKVEVYGEKETRYYNSSAGFETFELEKVVTNFYDMCPITVFSLNEDETGIFKPILSLQDAYNTLTSGTVDNYEDFADAYLVITGAIATSGDLADMKKNRCILLDGDGTQSVNFLTKNISDTQVTNILTNLDDHIFQISACPDFSDEVFGNASSGIALRFKLLNFENACSCIEAQMRKALQRVVELLSGILNLVNGEEMWREIEITFTRNLPQDIAEIINTVNALRGVVSQETLLAQIPFISDPKEEMKKVAEEEKSVLDLYPQWEDKDLEPDEEEEN